MNKQREKFKAACFMVRHYTELANEAKFIYNDLVDFYLVYDHYMMMVDKYNKFLDDMLHEYYG